MIKSIKSIFQVLLPIVICTLFSACLSSTLKVKTIDSSTGYFGNKEVKKADIIIDETISATDYKRLIYIKPSSQKFMSSKADKINAFVKDMIENIGYFERVSNKKEFEMLLIKTGVAYKVSGISDNIGLLQVQKHFGNYLIAEFDFALTLPKIDGTNSIANLKITDPSTMKIVFHAQRKTFLVEGFDNRLLYPLFNSFIDWLQRNSIKL